MQTVQPHNIETPALPALTYAEARDMYADALNAQADFLRDPQAWLNVAALFGGPADADALRAELAADAEHARKVWLLATAKAGLR